MVCIRLILVLSRTNIGRVSVRSWVETEGLFWLKIYTNHGYHYRYPAATFTDGMLAKNISKTRYS